MRKTVSNTNEYIENILADHPYFPEHAKSFLAEELTALQRSYFTFCPEVNVKERAISSDMQLSLSGLCDAREGIPEEKDIVAVFHAETELPKIDVLHFCRTKRPGFTVYNDKLIFRTTETVGKISVLLSCFPDAIGYSAEAGYQGDICVGEEYLPMVSARLRELVARLSGEEEEADHFADCYNAWLLRLKQEKGEKR